MMANFTMEIRELVENPLINGVFTFDYDFYGNEQEKAEFEKLFIQYYYFTEIGFETPERFKLKLQAKLNTSMPYYRQLAMTEWNKLRTVEQMMTSKNLEESTTHEQTITGDNETTTTGNTSSSSSANSSSNQSSKASSSITGTQTSSVTQNGKASNLADGVSASSLSDGYLTSVNQSSDEGNQSTTQSSTDESSLNGTQTLSNESSSDSSQLLKGNNNQTLRETTTYSSVGDIGIQTPAYAIAEWRKVLININQMIIDECRDLFMKIY